MTTIRRGERPGAGQLPIERSQRGEPRPYYCRTCGAEMESTQIPPGWYSLARHTGIVLRPNVRLGLYCSLDCLAGQLPRLSGIERAATDWQETAQPRDGRPDWREEVR